MATLKAYDTGITSASERSAPGRRGWRQRHSSERSGSVANGPARLKNAYFLMKLHQINAEIETDAMVLLMFHDMQHKKSRKSAPEGPDLSLEIEVARPRKYQEFCYIRKLYINRQYSSRTIAVQNIKVRLFWNARAMGNRSKSARPGPPTRRPRRSSERSGSVATLCACQNGLFSHAGDTIRKPGLELRQ